MDLGVLEHGHPERLAVVDPVGADSRKPFMDVLQPGEVVTLGAPLVSSRPDHFAVRHGYDPDIVVKRLLDSTLKCNALKRDSITLLP